MIFDRLFKKESVEDIFDVILGGNGGEKYIYEMARAKAINLIAKTVATTEIVTYEMKDNEVQKVKNDLYWSLNIQPNYVENGTTFLYKLMLKILLDGEALVIINKKGNSKLLYVADSFQASKNVMRSKTFTKVSISDNLGNVVQLDKEYNSDTSIYFSVKNSNMNLSEDIYKKNMRDLFEVITNKYIKSNTLKWRLKKPGSQPTMQDAETGKTISYKEYKEKITEGINSNKDSIILLSEMFDLICLNKDITQNLSDFKDIVKNIGDTVASRYNIPLDVFYGSKTEKSTGNDDFISYAIKPYFELIEDGLNATMVGIDDYKKGEYIEFNKQNMFHKDILDNANGIDKLTGDGFSRNEINDIIGLPQINEDWANEHHITKNYANVKGGEYDE